VALDGADAATDYFCAGFVQIHSDPSLPAGAAGVFAVVVARKESGRMLSHGGAARLSPRGGGCTRGAVDPRG
jgi:hypothetical protein